jgi:hypothetical protein
MKVLICGSRSIDSEHLLREALEESKFKVSAIISGGATGADRLGESYAKSLNLPLEIYKPDWKRFRKGAGIIRNKQMVEAADAVISLWDGKSRGTKSTIEYAKKVGKPVYVKIIRQHEDN